mgnify:CR=1 FL=1
MKISKRQLKKIIKEEKQKIIAERSSPALFEIESLLRRTLAEYVDTYMTSMQMNPGDPNDRRRVSQRINEIVRSIFGD